MKYICVWEQVNYCLNFFEKVVRKLKTIEGQDLLSQGNRKGVSQTSSYIKDLSLSCNDLESDRIVLHRKSCFSLSYHLFESDTLRR